MAQECSVVRAIGGSDGGGAGLRSDPQCAIVGRPCSSPEHPPGDEQGSITMIGAIMRVRITRVPCRRPGAWRDLQGE